MNAPYVRFLARFAEGPSPAVIAAGPDSKVAKAALDVAAGFAMELDEARREARSAAEADYDAATAKMLAAHRVELDRATAEARALRLAEEGLAVAAMVERAFTDLRLTISEQIAEALRPLLAGALVEGARKALAEALDLILADTDHPRLIMRGPMDFIAAMRAARTSGEAIDYVAEDTIDIVVTAGPTSITTRLGGALAALDKEA